MTAAELLAAPVRIVRAQPRRTVRALGIVAVVLAALMLLGLCYGARWIDPLSALSALTGSGRDRVVVASWRLPRVLAAVLFGAALGVSGALFQNLTRNPLGSPDVIGLDAGAYTGALIALTVLSGTSTQLWVCAVGTGLLAALLIYRLAAGAGLSGLRLVVIGIAVNAILTALNSWIILRSDLEIAIAAVGWSAGSLNGLDWSDVTVPFVVVAVLLALTAAASGSIAQAALGDSLAVTTGVRLDRLRLAMVVLGVATTAIVTAVCGPIVFIALVAPQIGRRLTRAPGVPLLPAALCGSVLLLAADLLAQALLAPVALPVGVVTTVLGGGYLVWMLTREARR